jgi:hypothetical protein
LDRSRTILVLHAVCFLAMGRVHKFKRLFVLIIRGGLVVFGKSGESALGFYAVRDYLFPLSIQKDSLH